MKKLTQLLIVLSLVGLPQLLSAYKHTFTNNHDSKTITFVVYVSASKRVHYIHINPQVGEKEKIKNMYGECTEKIVVKDGNKILKTINFGWHTCRGSQTTVWSDGGATKVTYHLNIVG